MKPHWVMADDQLSPAPCLIPHRPSSSLQITNTTCTLRNYRVTFPNVQTPKNKSNILGFLTSICNRYIYL